MPVLIDGNNLLHAARQVEPDAPPPGRMSLCKTLGDWARGRKQAVTVVFDGPQPSGALSEQIGDPDISVVFSGAGVSADAVLIRLLQQNSAPRQVLVVSTDREIVRAAKRRRAVSMRADDYWRMLRRDLETPQRRPPREPRAKRHGLTPEETDAWLRELGFDPDGPESSADHGP